jgi:hypothetical protein
LLTHLVKAQKLSREDRTLLRTLLDELDQTPKKRGALKE